MKKKPVKVDGQIVKPAPGKSPLEITTQCREMPRCVTILSHFFKMCSDEKMGDSVQLDWSHVCAQCRLWLSRLLMWNLRCEAVRRPVQSIANHFATYPTVGWYGQRAGCRVCREGHDVAPGSVELGGGRPPSC